MTISVVISHSQRLEKDIGKANAKLSHTEAAAMLELVSSQPMKWNTLEYLHSEMIFLLPGSYAPALGEKSKK
jgi:hypothetical protein